VTGKSHRVPDVREAIAGALHRRNDPSVNQTVRSTAAAVLSYLAALWLSSAQVPLLAPLTTLLVVQVTVYATLTRGIRRIIAVVAGVLLAVGFSSLVGLSWWSLGVLILAALILGHLVRVNEFVPEVAISAMIVLGVSVTRVAETALDRVVETLIGAVVGLLFNVLFVPPIWTQSAGDYIEDLAERMRDLLWSLGEEVGRPTPVEEATARLQEARRLDHDIVQVDAAVAQAEESLKLNPRVREGTLSRLVLRTGLDTLEICAVVLRVIARTLSELAEEGAEESLLPPGATAVLQELFAQLAAAIDAFTVLVTSDVTTDADNAEAELTDMLRNAHDARDRLAQLLLAEQQRNAEQWQLHGTLLTQIDRLLYELAADKRSARLTEELDFQIRQPFARHPRLAMLTRYAPFRRVLRRRKET
jgi:uncharacterized membrane protein YgaE (UPF0421/DUF939 family)